MEHSKLEKHKFKKGKFITPWNDMLGHLSMIFNAKWQNFCIRKILMPALV